jgi:uncharacterized membrane protein
LTVAQAVNDEPPRAAPLRKTRSVLVVALLLAYAVLSHVAATTGGSDLALAAWVCLVAPIALALRWSTGLPIAAALLALLAWVPTEELLKVPPVIIYLALAAWFGRTLLPGRQPIISRFASLERGELEPVLARYTRRLTVMWSAFFAVMAVTSAALALFADAESWSLFTNGLNYLLMALLFVGEYAYRRVRYSQYEHASFPRMLRMLFTAGKAGRKAAGR